MSADLVNGAYQFPVGDRVYYLKAQVDRDTERNFELFAHRRANQELAGSQDTYTPEKYDAEREDIKNGFRLGLYSMRQKRGADILGSVPGILFLTKLLLGDDASDDDVMALMGEYPVEIQDLLKDIIESSMEQTIKAAKKKMANGSLPKPTPTPNQTTTNCSTG